MDNYDVDDEDEGPTKTHAVPVFQVTRQTSVIAGKSINSIEIEQNALECNQLPATGHFSTMYALLISSSRAFAQTGRFAVVRIPTGGVRGSAFISIIISSCWISSASVIRPRSDALTGTL